MRERGRCPDADGSTKGAALRGTHAEGCGNPALCVPSVQNGRCTRNALRAARPNRAAQRPSRASRSPFRSSKYTRFGALLNPNRLSTAATNIPRGRCSAGASGVATPAEIATRDGEALVLVTRPAVPCGRAGAAKPPDSVRRLRRDLLRDLLQWQLCHQQCVLRRAIPFAKPTALRNDPKSSGRDGHRQVPLG